MAIPPNDNNVEDYFKSLSELNSSLGLKELSIGMSADYMKAVNYKATYLRLEVLYLVKDLKKYLLLFCW